MTDSSPGPTAPETPDAKAAAIDLTGMFDTLARDGAASIVDQCSIEERRALFDALLPWVRRDPERSALLTGGAPAASGAGADGRVDVATMMQSPEVVALKAATSQAQGDLTIAKDAMVERVAAEQAAAQDRASLDRLIAEGVSIALTGAAAIVPGAAGAELLAARAAIAILPTLRAATEVVPIKESDRGVLRKATKILHEVATPIVDADEKARAAAAEAKGAG